MITEKFFYKYSFKHILFHCKSNFYNYYFKLGKNANDQYQLRENIIVKNYYQKSTLMIGAGGRANQFSPFLAPSCLWQIGIAQFIGVLTWNVVQHGAGSEGPINAGIQLILKGIYVFFLPSHASSPSSPPAQNVPGSLKMYR